MDELRTNPFQSPTAVANLAVSQDAVMKDRFRLPMLSMLVVILAGILGVVVATCFAAQQWPNELSSANLRFSSIVGLMIGLVNMTSFVVAANTIGDRLSSTTNLLAALIGVAMSSYLFNVLWLTLASC